MHSVFSPFARHKTIPVLLFAGYIFMACDQFSDDRYTENKNIQGIREEIVATVNDKNILLKDFQREVSLFKSGFPNYQNFTEDENTYIKKWVVNKLIDKELIRQYIAEQGIRIGAEELSVSMEAATEQHSNEDIKRWLDARNITSHEWETRFEYLLLLDKFLNDRLKKEIPEVTEQEIKKYYWQHKNEYTVPLRYEILHLQVQNIALAQTLHRILSRNPSKFAELVNKFSISPDKATDGNIGLIEKGVMPPPLDQAIFKLVPQNRLSPLIKTSFGYHILYLKQVHPKTSMNLAEATDDIRQKIRKQYLEQVFLNRVQQFRETSNIVIKEEILRSDKGF